MGENIFDKHIEPTAMNNFLRDWSVKSDYSTPRCCEISSFMVDLSSTPHSPWNSSAAEIFTDDYIALHKLVDNPHNRKVIKNAFFNRVKSLLAEARLRRRGSHLRSLAKRNARRYQRKLNVRLLLSSCNYFTNLNESSSDGVARPCLPIRCFVLTSRCLIISDLMVCRTTSLTEKASKFHLVRTIA